MGAEMRSDISLVFLRKLNEMPPPVTTQGMDPKNWDVQGLPNNAESGAKYRVIMEKDPILDEINIKYEQVVEEGEEQHFPEYFSISGNHNDWSDDRMDEG